MTYSSTVSEDPDVRSALHFSIEDILAILPTEKLTFGLGAVGTFFADTLLARNGLIALRFAFTAPEL